MREKEIDDVLNTGPDVDPSLVDHIARSIGSSAAPVKPLLPSWMLAGALILICGALATAGASILGFHGIVKMNAIEIGLIFSVLAGLIWLCAVLCVAEHVPGSRRPVSPTLMVVGGCLALTAVFAALFHNYSVHRFLPRGVACLIAGLAQAIPVSLATWWLLSRGFALNPLTAGLIKGTLAGFAGVAMLELHCGNFEAPHVMIWHTAVIPISGAFGAFVAWTTRNRKSRPV